MGITSCAPGVRLSVTHRNLLIATIAGLTVNATCVSEPGKGTVPVSDPAPTPTDPQTDSSSIAEEEGDADAGVKAQGESAGPSTETEDGSFPDDDMDPLYAVPDDDMATIRQLVAALSANDKSAVARLFRYPVAPSVPLALIRNPEAFIRRYDELFDSKTIPLVLEGCKSPKANWERSAVTTSGPVWILGGEIIRLEVTTDKGRRAYARANAVDARTLHPSVRNYDAVLLECRTKRHYVRIHSLPSDYVRIRSLPNERSWRARYIAWKAGASPRSAPELSLTGGVVGGSAGSFGYAFKSGIYTYEVFVPVDHMCEGGDDCEPNLTVMMGERALSQQICRRLRSW